MNFAGMIPEGNPLCAPQAVIQGPEYRISILTERLVRLEYSSDGGFTDPKTQAVVNRAFPLPAFDYSRRGELLEIRTPHLRIVYDQQPFSENGLSIEVGGGLTPYHSTWFYGHTPETLKGTVRTLDDADGAVPLAEGLLSRGGFSLLDDSASMLFDEKGWAQPRKPGAIDLYFFGYGHDYLGCLRDFFTLCGPTPLLPRFALGNWWSRFFAYSDAQYRELMQCFQAERIPLSVAVLDMDWHVTAIDPKYGSGWTGYTWNRELFPDPAAFLDFLHSQGLCVTLNVHPAEGVRAHEEMYESMAGALGLDTQSEQKIEFNAADPDFLSAYFTYLHHPNEEIGVDFWWVDWQQSGGSRVAGLDPLFLLNHFHFFDSGRDQKRPLAFSRYAGFGSHRYPIGFSGDTHVTWASLAFQPYFTATASNVGYGWWSHDIGGHMHGIQDAELAARWVQFGTFSPIMRLHSGGNPFFRKEPWLYPADARAAMERFLRLRHRLVPYLYTMNQRLSAQGIPLVCPMYYFHPEEEAAYHVPNQYWFGSSLIACPITQPTDPVTKLGRFDAFLPVGGYYDLFNARHYRGGRQITMYRSLQHMPVLAPEGAILPLHGGDYPGNGTANPEHLTLCVFSGADGSFTLYEDNGLEGNARKSAHTTFTYTHGAQATLSILPPQAGTEALPQTRRYSLCLYGLDQVDSIRAQCDGQEIDCAVNTDELGRTCIEIPPLPIQNGIQIDIGSNGKIRENDLLSAIHEVLSAAEMSLTLKQILYQDARRIGDPILLLGHWQTLTLPGELYGALTEILCA